MNDKIILFPHKDNKSDVINFPNWIKDPPIKNILEILEVCRNYGIYDEPTYYKTLGYLSIPIPPWKLVLYTWKLQDEGETEITIEKIRERIQKGPSKNR